MHYGYYRLYYSIGTTSEDKYSEHNPFLVLSNKIGLFFPSCKKVSLYKFLMETNCVATVAMRAASCWDFLIYLPDSVYNCPTRRQHIRAAV